MKLLMHESWRRHNTFVIFDDERLDVYINLFVSSIQWYRQSVVCHCHLGIYSISVILKSLHLNIPDLGCTDRHVYSKKIKRFWKGAQPFYNSSTIIGALNPLSTRPHQNVVWYNNSWLGFLNILNYVPKEREKYTAKNEPSFVTVKCCDGS